jgi:dTDP-4-amino-4,6-dideoxygalactose transaminase
MCRGGPPLKTAEETKRALLPLARPSFRDAEAAAVRRVLASGWVAQGPEVAAFEAEFASAVGAPHACAVANGTAALHLALRAVGVGPGDEVVTVSHSYVATAASIRHCCALPVFVDIDPATGNLDPALLGAAIGPTTRAVLCVHQLGMPCDLQAILAVASARGLRVVEDAACAAGSEICWNGTWERIGRPRGDVACFSFHARKVLTTGEGGMVTTEDPAIDRRLRSWRSHGVNVAPEVRHASSRVEFESYEELGFNYRMSDLQAAVGREQLRRLPSLVARRRELAMRYGELLRAVDRVAAPTEPRWARSNWQSYAIRLDASLDQREVMQRMLDDGVATRRGVHCAHREPSFPPGTWRCGAGRAVGAVGAGDGTGANGVAGVGGANSSTCTGEPGRCAHLFGSEQAQDHSILLPLFPDMDDTDPARVVAALERACR